MTKSEPVDVTSRQGVKGGPAVVVGTIEIEIFDSTEEMAQFLGSMDKVLKLANTQYATDAKNKVRAAANVTLSEKKCRELAIEQLLNDKDLLQQLQDADVVLDKRDELVNGLMADIRAAHDAARSAAVADAPVVDEDEDED